MAPGPAPEGQARRRRKLWQIGPGFRCSLIGTCLALEDLRRVATKARLAIDPGITDYELHRMFVGIAGEFSPAARLVQQALDRKYRSELSRFARARREDALAALWAAAQGVGTVAGAYWALLTHPSATARLIQRAAGEVHMLSHLAGASHRARLEQLEHPQCRCVELEQALARAQTAAQRRQQEQQEIIGALNLRLASGRDLEQRLRHAEERVNALQSGEILERYRRCAEKYAARLADSRVRAQRAERCLALLEQELLHSQRERDALEVLLERLFAGASAGCDKAQSAQGSAGLDLRGRCILYVGGRVRQCPHLRALVERLGGRFLHHDGGLEDARTRLGALLPRADVVLLPVDCVSHDASRRVKEFCRRQAKPLVLLRTASLSAFTLGLTELAGAGAR